MHLLHPSTVPHHYKQVLLCLLTSFDPRAVPHYNQVLLNSLTSLSSSAVLHRNRVLLCLLTSLVPSAIPIMTKSSHAFFDFTGVSLQCTTQKPSPSVLTEFSSVQSRDRLGRRGDMRDDSAEILFQSFLQEALVSSSGMGRDVHSLMLPIQHFLCRPRRRPPSKVS